MTLFLKADPLHPDPSTIGAAVAILRQGGVIAYPTETFYALGVDCFQEEAVAKVFAIKGRIFSSPIALIGGNEDHAAMITDSVSETARRLMRAFWPGPLTLIFSASRPVPVRLTAGTGKIGIRVSSHPIAMALAETLGRPITATSANLSGSGECVSAEEVTGRIGHQVQAIIDGGLTPGGKGSTMLEVTTDPPVVLREGAITAKTLAEWYSLGKRERS